MYTIALLSQKGGTGKTMTTFSLAVASERAGHPTVVVDLDPQASASKWSDLRDADSPVVTSAHASRLAPVLKAAREGGAELVVIDTAPHAADAALQAARAANLVLIPCRPSAPDLKAIGATIDLARIADTRAVAILNAVDSPCETSTNIDSLCCAVLPRSLRLQRSKVLTDTPCDKQKFFRVWTPCSKRDTNFSHSFAVRRRYRLEPFIPLVFTLNSSMHEDEQ